MKIKYNYEYSQKNNRIGVLPFNVSLGMWLMFVSLSRPVARVGHGGELSPLDVPSAPPADPVL